MLKVPEQEPPSDAERPVGELVQQLVEDGKAYARAELGVVKAIAADKANALALPAALLVVALLLGLAGISAMAVGIVLALAKFVGPLLAGVVGMLIFAGIAGALVWYAVKRIRSVL